MKVVVVGAGGLGSYVGAKLCHVGHDVTLVARGEHLAAIAADGLFVETVEGDFHVRPEAAATALDVPGADLTIVSVKAYSLDDVADQVAHLAARGSVVLSLLNGVTACERLTAHGVPGGALLDGIAYMTAFRTAPGRVSRKAAHHRLVVGSTTGAGEDAVRLVQEAFSATGIDIVVPDDVRVELWTKKAVVCALSVLCGLSGQSMGPFRTHRFAEEMQRRAIAEVTTVGRALGVALPPETEEKVGSALDAFPYDFVPSVINDLREGRSTEMEELGGALVAMAREVGVDVPLHEAATLAIQLGEPG